MDYHSSLFLRGALAPPTSYTEALASTYTVDFYPIVDPVYRSISDSGAAFCWLRAIPPQYQEDLIEVFPDGCPIASELIDFVFEAFTVSGEIDEVWPRLYLILVSQSATPNEPVHTLQGLISGVAGTVHADTCALALAADLRSARNLLRNRDADMVPPALVNLLNSKGIPCSAEKFTGHIHGGEKAVEMSMLLDIAAPKLTGEVTVSCCKDGKFNLLRAARPGVNFHLANYRMDERDFLRYQGTPFFDGHIVGNTWFCLDNGHFLTDESVAQIFAVNPQLENILVTGVHPFEADLGLSSVHPWLYRLRYLNDGSVQYCFPGTDDGAYPIPLDNKFFVPRQVEAVFSDVAVKFTRSVEATRFAHALVSYVRIPIHKAFPTLETFVAGDGSFVRVPEALVVDLNLSRENGKLAVPSKLLQNVITYLPVLVKERDPKSIQAKINSVATRPEYDFLQPEDWENLRLVALATSHRSPDLPVPSMFQIGPITQLFYVFMRHAGRFVKDHYVTMLAHTFTTLFSLYAPWTGFFLDAALTAYDLYQGQNKVVLYYAGLHLAQRFFGRFTNVLAVLVKAGLIGHHILQEMRVAKVKLYVAMISDRVTCEFKPEKVFLAMGTPEAATWLTPAVSARENSHELEDLLDAFAPCGHFVEDQDCFCEYVLVTREPLGAETWECTKSGHLTSATNTVDELEPSLIPEAPKVAEEEPVAEPKLNKGKGREVPDEVVENESSHPKAGTKLQQIAPALGSVVHADNSNAIDPAGDVGEVLPMRGHGVPGSSAGVVCFDPAEVEAGPVQEGRFDITNADPLILPHGIVTQINSNVTFEEGGYAPLPLAMNLPEREFTNPTYMIDSGETADVEYVRNCGVGVASLALELPEEVVWHELCSNVAQVQLQDWLKKGTNRVFFEVVGVLYKARFMLKGLKGGKAVLVGARSREAKTHTIQYDAPKKHWFFVETANAKPIRQPAMPNHTIDRSEDSRDTAKFIRDLDRLPDEHGKVFAGRFQEYEATWGRAENFLRESAAGVVGTMNNLEKAKILPAGCAKAMMSIAEGNPSRKVLLRTVAGYGGCSKSSPLQNVLRANLKSAGITWFCSFPRSALLSDFYNKLKSARQRFDAKALNTMEVAFARDADVCIVDEVSLQLPGYVDALILTHSFKYLIVMGDPTQCDAHALNTESRLNDMTPEALHIFSSVDTPWFAWTHRSPQFMARASRIPSSNPVEGKCFIASSMHFNKHLIVATDLERKNYLPSNRRTFTPGTIQGQEHDYIQIVVSTNMLNVVAPKDVWTAACRTKHTLRLIPSANVTKEQIRAHPIFGALLGGQPYDFMSNIGDKYLGKLKVQYPEPVEFAAIMAKRREVVEERGFSTIESLTLPTRVATLYENVVPEAFVSPPDCSVEVAGLERFSTHLPLVDETALKIEMMREMPDRMQREFVNVAGRSECYDDEKYPAEMARIFPSQKRTDAAFSIATIEARLSRSTVVENEANFVSRAWVADQLFHATMQGLGISEDVEEFDWDLYESCVRDQVECRRKKTGGMAEQIDERSDAWGKPMEDIKHWIKSQDKAKLEAFILEHEKAGQTISTCNEIVIALFGAMFRYITAQVARHKTNDHVLIYKGLNPTQLNDQIKENWRPDGTTVNDFTAFDSTQDGTSVGLESSMARWAQIPERWIGAYVYWKTHQYSSAVGIKSTARDSGEPNTFDGNTFYSFAVTTLKYGVQAMWEGFWVFGGDDMAHDRHVEACARWRFYSKHIATVSKTQHPDLADFCGWILTHEGIIRSPTLMALKIWFKLARGQHPLQFAASFALELYFSYHKSHATLELLPCIDRACLAWCVSWLHKVVPVLCASLFAAPELTVLERLKRKFTYWSACQFKGRQAALKQLRAAMNRFERGFCGVSPLTSSSGKCFDLTSSTNMSSFISSVANVSDANSRDAMLALYNELGVPRGVAGNAWDLTKRRFVHRVTIGTAAVVAAGANIDGVYNVDIHSLTHIATFIQNAPIADVISVTAQVSPRANMAGQFIEVATALTMENDATAVADIATALGKPTGQADYMTFMAAGGMPNAFTRDLIIGSFGVSKQIKPAPLVGARPRFNIAFQTNHAGGVPAGTQCLILNLYIWVQLRSA